MHLIFYSLHGKQTKGEDFVAECISAVYREVNALLSPFIRSVDVINMVKKYICHEAKVAVQSNAFARNLNILEFPYIPYTSLPSSVPEETDWYLEKKKEVNAWELIDQKVAEMQSMMPIKPLLDKGKKRERDVESTVKQKKTQRRCFMCNHEWIKDNLPERTVAWWSGGQIWFACDTSIGVSPSHCLIPEASFYLAASSTPVNVWHNNIHYILNGPCDVSVSTKRISVDGRAPAPHPISKTVPAEDDQALLELAISESLK